MAFLLHSVALNALTSPFFLYALSIPYQRRRTGIDVVRDVLCALKNSMARGPLTTVPGLMEVLRNLLKNKGIKEIGADVLPSS